MPCGILLPRFCFDHTMNDSPERLVGLVRKERPVGDEGEPPSKRLKYVPRAQFRVAHNKKGSFMALGDLRKLVLHLTADMPQAGPATVGNKKYLANVCVICIAGLHSKLYNANKRCMPFLSSQNIVSTKPTGKNKNQGHLSSLLFQDLSPKLPNRVPTSSQSGQQTFPYEPTMFLLSNDELEENGFPSPSCLNQSNSVYFDTKPMQGGLDIVALDCEMCETNVEYELTRCALVNMDGVVVYDEYVKPENPIIDYKTEYSGITEQHLQGIKKRLCDVQKDLSSLISADTIIVGHALHNDFSTLRMVHRKVIDTALMFPHPNGSPSRSALRFLAHKFLHKSVQGYNSDMYVKIPDGPLDADDQAVVLGHSPIEDAHTCIELLKLKMRYGPDFGVDKSFRQNVLEVIRRAKLFVPVAFDDQKVLKHWFPQWSRRAVANDGQAFVEAQQSLQHSGKMLVWAQLHALDVHLSHLHYRPRLKFNLCRVFQSKGQCPRMDNCHFAHGESELCEQARYPKSSLCRAFQKYGQCGRQDKCVFAHGETELCPKPTNPLESVDTPQTAAGAPNTEALAAQSDVKVTTSPKPLSDAGMLGSGIDATTFDAPAPAPDSASAPATAHFDPSAQPHVEAILTPTAPVPCSLAAGAVAPASGTAPAPACAPALPPDPAPVLVPTAASSPAPIPAPTSDPASAVATDTPLPHKFIAPNIPCSINAQVQKDAAPGGIAEMVTSLDEQVKRLWSNAPHNTAFIVYGGLGEGCEEQESPVFLFTKHGPTPASSDIPCA